MATTIATTGSKNQRRLVLTVYRGFMRWCKEIPPMLPLDEFISPRRGMTMDNVKVFRQVLRATFREESAVPVTERIQDGVSGLRQLNLARPHITAYSRQWGENIRNMHEKKKSKKSTATRNNFDEREWVQEQLDRISWLPKLEESAPMSFYDVDAKSRFPLFPIRGPIFHEDAITSLKSASSSLDALPLPLFSLQQEIPLPGLQVPFRIFEPRYRQLYTDLSTSGDRQVVVPFAHPFIPGRFARHGMVHELTNLQKVTEESNGKIQYLADHVVTNPVEIKHILNPQVWATQETYVQIHGELIDLSIDGLHTDLLEPLRDVVLSWKGATSHPLATKSLLALGVEDVWAVVSLWCKHFQQELHQLQLGVYTQVKRQAGLNDILMVVNPERSQGYTLDHVAKAQEPHRRRLLQLMLDTSLLVPTLLTLDEQGKCQYLIDMMNRERHFIQTNSFEK
jgi:hypothetical protein